MRKLLSIILIIGFWFPLYLSAEAEYNEYITDIYFGNGVWNTFAQADEGKRQIKKRLIEKGLIKKDEILGEEENINSSACKKYAFKIAYNWHGMYRDDSGHDEQFKQFFDLAETFVQLKESGQVENSSLFKFLEWFVVDHGYPEKFKKQLKSYIALATTTHQSNILEMSADYQQYSFDKGHRVLLVSHSQGNLWANDMVKTFKPWQKEYFRNVGVAVPADHLEAESRYVTLSCDLVMAIIPGHLESNKECYGVEDISGHEFLGSYLRNDNSEQEIFRDIEFYLLILNALPSQWETDQESDKNTKDYKITVKHKYDPNNIIMNQVVYPFNTDKKLYQLETGEYVKASCGGKSITDSWEGQDTETEFWKIDNPQEEKITNNFECSTAYANGYDIMATYCSYNSNDKGHFWLKDSGFIDIPSADKGNYANNLSSQYNWCGIYKQATINSWGGSSYCYEAHVYWSKKPIVDNRTNNQIEEFTPTIKNNDNNTSYLNQ